MDIVSVNGNNSWKFQDDAMTGTLSKSVADGQTNRQTDGQTEIRVLRATWSQLKCRSVILYSWKDIITQDIDQTSRSLPNTFQLFACWINQKCLSISITTLTHWGRDKMAAVSQTILSNPFSWMKMLEFRLKFHRSLFLGVQLTIIQHWFR